MDNSDLEALVTQFSTRDLPPVSQWNPARQRSIDMRIDDGGAWYYHGSEITRSRMVALFSTILRRDQDEYFLVTPQEKLLIKVDNVPFVARLMNVNGAGRKQQLEFTDNVGNVFIAGSECKLWMGKFRDQEAPYVMVRENLAALLSRAVYYQLADLLSVEDGETGVWSNGVFFRLM